MNAFDIEQFKTMNEHPIRILSLEDDEMAFLMLKRTVLSDANLDCEFVWTRTVDEALDYLQDEQIHLCFIDYNLGNENGFDLIRRLPPDQTDTPCILLTGSDNEWIGDEALKYGFYDYLVKDRIDGQELRRAIRHALKRQEIETQLRSLALKDILTGAYNRAAFVDHLEQIIKRRRRHGGNFGVIYVDLDRFKAVNDAGGHKAGDAVLREVVRRLRAGLRESDILARLGGDEFAICCTDIDSAESLTGIADKLVAALAVPFVIEGIPFSVNCSAGISFSDDSTQNVELLIQASDLAMYEAKRAGGNRSVAHSRELSEQHERRTVLERRLAIALAGKKLSVAYQPIVNINSGQVESIEALARWHDDDLGPVSPAEFIPIAETSGMIGMLAMAVFEQASLDLRQLKEAPGFANTRLALNLSVRQLSNPSLVSAIQELLQECGIAPEEIEFEVTEGFFEADEEALIAQVRQLKDIGTRISVDDFGTGYSSLSRLKNYPLDAFKIDRSFISGIESNDSQRRLCTAIVELGHALNVDVIGEGIETEEQLAILRQAGCCFGQGFLLSRPATMPVLIETAQSKIAKVLQNKPFH